MALVSAADVKRAMPKHCGLQLPKRLAVVKQPSLMSPRSCQHTLDVCVLPLALQITVVEDDEDAQPYGCAPPPTTRQTASGGHPAGSSSLSGAATAAAAAEAVAAEHAAGRSGGWQLGFRFFGRAQQQLARRRSSRAGAAAGGSGGDTVMTWASLDDSSGTQFNAPLLQFDMQEQVRQLRLLDADTTALDASESCCLHLFARLAAEWALSIDWKL